MSDMAPKYDPRIFLQDSIEHAQMIILTPEAGLTTQQRWEQETEWLTEHIRFPSPIPLVIDYGCGIGRIAKQLENPVLGIDMSPTMRQQAIEYVFRPSFATTHPPMLRLLLNNGLRAHGAIAIWCLQHVLDLGYDTQLLFDALVPGSYLWTLDAARRYIPASFSNDDNQDDNEPKFIWTDDGESVPANLDQVGFVLLREQAPPLSLCEAGAKLRQWVRP